MCVKAPCHGLFIPIYTIANEIFLLNCLILTDCPCNVSFTKYKLDHNLVGGNSSYNLRFPMGAICDICIVGYTWLTYVPLPMFSVAQKVPHDGFRGNGVYSIDAHASADV